MRQVPLIENIDSLLAPEYGDEGISRTELLGKAVRGAMQKGLTDRQRDAIELYYYKGLTTTQIAAMWGVDRSAVSRHLSRARKRISQIVIIP